jgi:hypothetical protein
LSPDRPSGGSTSSFDLVLVGDQGMITQTRIEEDIKPAGAAPG